MDTPLKEGFSSIVPVSEDITGVTPGKEEKFFPAGAIVFFICLVLLSLIFWYGIYFLMIERA